MLAGGIKTIQPYLVFATSPFYQTIYSQDGISHFYAFQSQEKQEVKIVPSGCMDWLFCYTQDGHSKEPSLQGTVLGLSIAQGAWSLEKNAQYFGVRFENGYIPNFMKTTTKDLIGKQVPFEEVVHDIPFLKSIAIQDTFAEQIKSFLQVYGTVHKRQDPLYSKHSMINHSKKMIYESNGFVKIEKIAEHLGYTERYLNKIFTEEIGCSAKALCKVVRFQALLVRLHLACTGSEEGKVKMIEIASELGFYDQAQMNKECKSLAHMSPKQYVSLLEEKNYVARIHNIALL